MPWDLEKTIMEKIKNARDCSFSIFSYYNPIWQKCLISDQIQTLGVNKKSPPLDLFEEGFRLGVLFTFKDFVSTKRISKGHESQNQLADKTYQELVMLEQTATLRQKEVFDWSHWKFITVEKLGTKEEDF